MKIRKLAVAEKIKIDFCKVFSKKAMKIDIIFSIDLMLTTKRQIDGEDFINFCDLPGKHEV